MTQISAEQRAAFTRRRREMSEEDRLAELRREGESRSHEAAEISRLYEEDSCREGNDQSRVSRKIVATPFSWPDPSTIPPRRWLLGYWLLRGEITAVIAPGGIGKSTFTVGAALAMASGRDLLGRAIHEGQCRAWLWNLEDDRDELARQVTACGLHHSIGEEACRSTLYVDSGLDMALCTAIEGCDGFEIVEPVYAALKAEIEKREIDVLIVDPFVSSHQVSENDNVMIDKVAKRWKLLAHETNCAIVLVHHTKKMAGREVRAEDSRGAVALIAAARIVLTLNAMTKEEGERFGITDSQNLRRFIRVDDDKANRSPPEAAAWFRKASVSLENSDTFHRTDNVGAIEPWTPPDPFEGVSARDLYDVQLRVNAGTFGHSSQAKDWAGKIVAEVLGLDLGDKSDKARTKTLLSQWIANDAFEIEHRDDDGKGRKRPFLLVKNMVDPTTLPTPQSGVGKVGEVG